MNDEILRWKPFVALISRRLIDGKTGWGELMRRSVKGQWQYREMTEREKWDRVEETIW